MENEISISTDKQCHCKSPIKQFFKQTQRITNVIGDHSTPHIESKYMCSFCGSLYGPTENNGFELGSGERYGLAEKLFNTTYSAKILRWLEDDQIVAIPDKNSSSNINSFTFQKGDICHVVRNTEKDPFLQKPYLVYGDSDEAPEVVFWAPLKYVSVPLSKMKKKALVTKASKNKKTKKIDKTTQIMAKNVDTISTIKPVKTEPLPNGSIPAVVVVIPELGFDYRFYIPKDAVG